MSVASEGSERDMQCADGAARNGTADSDPTKKRFLVTHSKDQDVLSEKKLRRLEKNRISARDCRRRKREATEQKLRQINILEAENLRLRVQLEIGQEGEKNAMLQQNTIMQELDDLLTSGASEAEIYEKIEEYKEKYLDYGTNRRSSIDSHLRQIERLLMPTQTTSVVMTAFQAAPFGSNISDEVQAESDQKLPGSFEASSASSLMASQSTSAPAAAAVEQSSGEPPNPNLQPKAFFHHLVNYLQVTPQQAAALKDSRFVAKELDACLEKAFTVLKELRNRLAQTGEDLESEFDQVRKTLTPTQAAKFLIWVANNKACMHMLNELWDRVYPNENIFNAGDDTKSRPSESAADARN
jgi:hypothetical protein